MRPRVVRCDELQADLKQYGKKPGSSKEDLSFTEDAEIVREMLNELDAQRLRRVFGS